jgi:AbrB family looped-hinge helix DNA binding protein
LQHRDIIGKVIPLSRFTTGQPMNATVTLSSKYQIVIPQAAREALSLQAGDELLVLCKSDRVVIVPKPKKFAKRTAGLHREVWQGAEAYLRAEREEW